MLSAIVDSTWLWYHVALPEIVSRRAARRIPAESFFSDVHHQFDGAVLHQTRNYHESWGSLGASAQELGKNTHEQKACGAPLFQRGEYAMHELDKLAQRHVIVKASC